MCKLDDKGMEVQRQAPFEARLRQDFDMALREAGEFYGRSGAIYRTLRALASHLDEAGIPYAVLGAIALAQYGRVRMTEDIDILLTADGLKAFHERFVGRGYVLAFEGARKSFRDAETGVRIEVVTTGEYPGDGKPKPVSFPDPTQASVDREGIRVLTLEKLVELKLASGQSAPHRLRDLADVQDLMHAKRLPAEFGEKLDASVRAKYRQLWDTVQAAGTTHSA